MEPCTLAWNFSVYIFKIREWNFILWLPDGIFSYPKSQYIYTYMYILKGLGMENVGFCGHLEYFISIRCILGAICIIWYIFPVLVFWTKKNLAALTEVRQRLHNRVLWFLPGCQKRRGVILSHFDLERDYKLPTSFWIVTVKIEWNNSD
jgi:hypothetical protein